MSVASFQGFGIGNYRSFRGADISYVGPFERVHILTGQNNAGKSSIMDAAYRLLPALCAGEINTSSPPLSEEDLPIILEHGESHAFHFSLCFSLNAIEQAVQPFAQNIKRYFDELFTMLTSIAFTHGTPDVVWLDYQAIFSKSYRGNSVELKPDYEQFIKSGTAIHLRDISLSLCSTAGQEESNYQRIIKKITPWNLLPQTIWVQAIRDVSPREYKPNDPIEGGEGLPNALLYLKNPDARDYSSASKRYSAFMKFVRGVLNDPGADVLVSSSDLSVSVKTTDTPFLPLDQLGTGIKELIIIAAVIACNSNKLICIEEPEIHMHPALQSRLMSYLLNDDSNRFLITTHSQTVINTRGVSISHITKANGISSCSTVAHITQIRDLLDDLGAKASDVLQANYLIWVEGPSDRIYINSWIHRINPDLVEGIHYGIVQYGGKLLSHLEATPDNENEDLFNLFRVNTHFCILMDSDRDKKRGRLSRAKYRIISECEKSDSMSWVTDGRTIENYVPADVLKYAIANLYPKKRYSHPLDDPYTCPLSFQFSGVKYGPNKVDIARQVARVDYELSRELSKHVDELCKRICKANAL